ncbi:MAG: hypothetical protein LBR75_02115 [Prevotellaceae bacterium]|jgi:hypothetical protein|nr:hypothetical protein [Prevotellaceae bacterium]
MATTFDYIIYKYERKKDKTRSVIIRITKDRKKNYVRTSFLLTREDLTKSFKIRNQKYIDVLEDLLRLCRKWANDNAVLLPQMSIEQVSEVVEQIVKNGGEIKKIKEIKKFTLDFIRFGIDFSNELIKQGKEGTGRNRLNAVRNLNKFLISLGYPVGNDGYVSFDINDFRAKTVKNYIEWIKNSPPPKGKKKGERAQSLYPITLRKIHNEAKERYNDYDEDIMNIPFSPFDRIKLGETSQTRKRARMPKQIRGIAELIQRSVYREWSMKNDLFNLSKDVFILSFGLMGINSADLFYATDYSEGRISYKRQKTKDRRADEAFFSVKVEKEVAELFERYRDKSGKRVFCFYKMYSTKDTFNYSLNKGLKRVGAALDIEDLEFGAARHSWGTIARNECKLSKHDVSEFMNHAPEGSMKTTDIYLKKDYTLQDEANRKVLELVFKKIDYERNL